MGMGRSNAAIVAALIIALASSALSVASLTTPTATITDLNATSATVNNLNVTAANVTGSLYYNGANRTDTIANPQEGWSFLIYPDGSNYKAKAANGTIAFTDTDRDTVVQDCLTDLTSSGGTIFLADVSWNSSLTVPDDVIVVEQLNNSTKRFINSADSQGSPYTISTDGTNIYVQDSALSYINSWTSTNASYVINKTIDDLTSGGKIFVRAGNYSISQKIPISTDEIVIMGEGWNTVLTLANDVNDDMFEINKTPDDSIYGVEFRQMRLEGNSDNNNAGNALDFHHQRRCKVIGVYIHEFEDRGITVGTIDAIWCGQIWIQNCYIRDCGEEGIYLGTAADDGWILQTQVTGSKTTDNVRLELVGHCEIVDLHSSGAMQAGLFMNGWGNQVIGGEFEMCYGHGIKVAGGGTNIGQIIIGANVKSNGRTSGNGIHLTSDSGFVTVMGCKIWNEVATYDTQAVGIYMYNSNNNLVMGNDIWENTDRGISIEGNSDNNQVTHNEVRDNGAYGIRVQDATCNDNKIKDNRVSGHTTSEIKDSGTGTKFRDNVGFVTENSGTQTCADNEDIAHGLAGTPTIVHVDSMNATYDSTPVIVNVDWSGVDGTNINVGVYWTNGTAITDDTILVSWSAKYEP